MAQVLTKAMDRNVEATLSLLNDIGDFSTARCCGALVERSHLETRISDRGTNALHRRAAAPGRTPQDVGAANRSASRRGIHLQ